MTRENCPLTGMPIKRMKKSKTKARRRTSILPRSRYYAVRSDVGVRCVHGAFIRMETYAAVNSFIAFSDLRRPVEHERSGGTSQRRKVEGLRCEKP